MTSPLINLTVNTKELVRPETPSLIFEFIGRDYGINDTMFNFFGLPITPREVYVLDFSLSYFFWGVFLLAVCFVFHEAFHVWVMNKVTGKKVGFVPQVVGEGWKKKIVLNVGTPEDYKNITDREYIAILMAGVLGGLIPVVCVNLLWGLSIRSMIVMFVALTLYGIMIWDDIKNMWLTLFPRGGRG